MSFQREVRIWLFFAGIWKKLLPFSKSVSLNFSIWKDSWKNKKHLHLGQKLLYLGILGLEFEKIIVIFEINALWIYLIATVGAK